MYTMPLCLLLYLYGILITVLSVVLILETIEGLVDSDCVLCVSRFGCSRIFDS